eukprot:scaffold801_cov296-Prasinococcus_capsulatus_cf.AAC.3
MNERTNECSLVRWLVRSVGLGERGGGGCQAKPRKPAPPSLPPSPVPFRHLGEEPDEDIFVLQPLRSCGLQDEAAPSLCVCVPGSCTQPRLGRRRRFATHAAPPHRGRARVFF